MAEEEELAKVIAEELANVIAKDRHRSRLYSRDHAYWLLLLANLILL